MQRQPESRSKIGGWPLAAGITVVLVFLFFIRQILLPFILAAALSFLLTPLVDWLGRRLRLRRWIAAVLVYFGVLIVLGLFGYFVGGPLVRDLVALLQQLPNNLRLLIGELAQYASTIVGHPINAGAIANAILSQIQTLLGNGGLISFVGYGVAAVFLGILFFVVLIYFLVSGRTIAEGVFWLIPPEYRKEVRAVAGKILPVLWRYFLGLAVIVAYTSSVAGIGFGLVFHLPQATLLAIVVGLFELVPIVGPAATIVIVTLTAVQQAGLFAMIGLIVFAVALRISIDELVGPLVLGQAARVHPIVVIFAFLSGAILFGVIGLILAVPVAASIKIILGTYYAEPVAEEPRLTRRTMPRT